MAPQDLPMHVGYHEQYQEYIGVLRKRGGKPLNEIDIRRGYAAWNGLSMEDRPKAIEDMRERVQKGTKPEYLPFPVNHLLAQPWTRTAGPQETPRAEDYGYEVVSPEERRRREGYGLEPPPRRLA